MGIAFTGGAVRPVSLDPTAEFVVSNREAADLAWRDFRAGLSADEREYFEAPREQDGRRLVSSTRAGRAALAAFGADPAAAPHEHVARLLRAADDGRRTIHAMPILLFADVSGDMQWMAEMAARREAYRLSATLNGYGVFRVGGHLDLRSPGITQHTSDARDTAVLYVSHAAGEPMDPLARSRLRSNPSTFAEGRRDGDDAQTMIEREAAVTLHHELVFHAIMGLQHGSGPGGGLTQAQADAIVRQIHVRVRRNFNETRAAARP